MKITMPESVKGVFFIFTIIFLLSHLQNCCPCKTSFHFYPATEKSLPFLEVSGNYYQIGYTIGNYFKREIQLAQKRRNVWFNNLKKFITTDKDQLYQQLKTNAKAFYPQLIDELRGISDGSEIPFDDLFLLNVKSEISARMALNKTEEPSGCSTIYLIDKEQKLIFHNEDGNVAYHDLMFMVKATPPSGVTFIALTYPGYLMGNGPALNNCGIIQTTNFISSARVKNGIPRYFLGRAILEAKSIDEAIKIATHPERAFAYHHNLASIQTKKILSLEVTPDNHEIIEPDFIYFHTNHLILDQTKNFPQDTDYVKSSSFSRYKTISQALNSLSNGRKITIKDIFQILSSHQNAPYSPCRHPEDGIKGSTLATALFDIEKGTMRIYKGNPCQSYQNKNFSQYSFKMGNSSLDQGKNK